MGQRVGRMAIAAGHRLGRHERIGDGFLGAFDRSPEEWADPAVIEPLERVLVDLSGVKYIDSSGVASLVEAFQVAKKKGQTFALVSVNASALRVLELARLDKVFTIHENLADAL